MKRSFFIIAMLALVGLGLQACGMKPSPEASCDFVQNNDLQRVSWGSQVPVIMYVDSSVPSKYFDSIQGAVNEWNSKVGREVIKIGGWTDAHSSPKQDAANVIYYMNTWEDDRSNEQARTTVYWSGNRIYEADIRLNARDFTFFETKDPVAGRVDMQSLVLHEMGHVLGLAHTITPQSVMARSLPSATLRRELSSNDENSIRCEY